MFSNNRCVLSFGKPVVTSCRSKRKVDGLAVSVLRIASQTVSNVVLVMFGTMILVKISKKIT